jgi:hypothetical protein
MLPSWILRLSTSHSYLKGMLTPLNCWFMNTLSTICHALTLSQLVCSQVVLVQILFPMQQVPFNVASYYLICKRMYYIYNVHLNLIGENQTHQPTLNRIYVEDILRLDYGGSFFTTELHYWEYSLSSWFGTFQ